MMTKEQIITRLIDCLEQQLHSGMGHMQEKYYKADIEQVQIKEKLYTLR